MFVKFSLRSLIFSHATIAYSRNVSTNNIIIEPLLRTRSESIADGVAAIDLR